MLIWTTDIQRFCLHDGPGIRTTVFFQGCPLRCAWCHNPECLTAGPKLRYTPARCIGCGACVSACPRGCHTLAGPDHTLDRSRCNGCGPCAVHCPTGALGLVGEQRSPEEILDVVERDRPFYDRSGGGVTLSGGEPLAQAAGAGAVLSLAHARGIHTAVETCGYAEWRRIEPLLELVDLWLCDIKHLDPDAHRALTGKSNRRILANLKRLVSARAEVVLRVPVIPGQNDGNDYISLLVGWLARYDSLREVHLMPYHRLAGSKYENLGLSYAMRDTDSVPPAVLDSYTAALGRLGCTVRVGG